MVMSSKNNPNMKQMLNAKKKLQSAFIFSPVLQWTIVYVQNISPNLEETQIYTVLQRMASVKP